MADDFTVRGNILTNHVPKIVNIRKYNAYQVCPIKLSKEIKQVRIATKTQTLATTKSIANQLFFFYKTRLR